MAFRKKPTLKDFEAGLLRPMRNRSNPPLEYKKALEEWSEEAEHRIDWLETIIEDMKTLGYKESSK